MTPEMGIVTVIGLIVTLVILIFKHLDDKAIARKKVIDDKDKEIDSASDADGIIRASGELRK